MLSDVVYDCNMNYDNSRIGNQFDWIADNFAALRERIGLRWEVMTGDEIQEFFWWEYHDASYAANEAKVSALIAERRECLRRLRGEV